MDKASAIAAGLSEPQRQRLLEWPEKGSTFRGISDDIARELCALGIGKIVPWGGNGYFKGGRQMALNDLGLAIRTILIEESGDAG